MYLPYIYSNLNCLQSKTVEWMRNKNILCYVIGRMKNVMFIRRLFKNINKSIRGILPHSNKNT